MPPKQVDGGLVSLAESAELLECTINVDGGIGAFTRKFPLHQQRIVAIQRDGQLRLAQQLTECLGIVLVAGKSRQQRPAVAVAVAARSDPPSDEGQNDGTGNLLSVLLEVGNLDSQRRRCRHLVSQQIGRADVIHPAVLRQPVAQRGLAAGRAADDQDDGALRLVVGRGVDDVRKVVIGIVAATLVGVPSIII